MTYKEIHELRLSRLLDPRTVTTKSNTAPQPPPTTKSVFSGRSLAAQPRSGQPGPPSPAFAGRSRTIPPPPIQARFLTPPRPIMAAQPKTFVPLSAYPNALRLTPSPFVRHSGEAIQRRMQDARAGYQTPFPQSHRRSLGTVVQPVGLVLQPMEKKAKRTAKDAEKESAQDPKTQALATAEQYLDSMDDYKLDWRQVDKLGIRGVVKAWTAAGGKGGLTGFKQALKGRPKYKAFEAANAKKEQDAQEKLEARQRAAAAVAEQRQREEEEEAERRRRLNELMNGWGSAAAWNELVDDYGRHPDINNYGLLPHPDEGGRHKHVRSVTIRWGFGDAYWIMHIHFSTREENERTIEHAHFKRLKNDAPGNNGNDLNHPWVFEKLRTHFQNI